jgi:hypothetical protein
MHTPTQIERPYDVAVVIVCLASDGAHRITGASIPVHDGLRPSRLSSATRANRHQRLPYLGGNASSSGPEGEWCLIDHLRGRLDLEFEFKCVIFDAEVGGLELK